MKTQRKISRMFFATIGMFLLTSVSVILLLFPEGDRGNTGSIFSIITGVLFWIGILGGTGFYLFTYFSNKNLILSKAVRRKMPSFIRFYSNRYAAVIDTLLFISLIVIISCTINIKANKLLEWFSLFLFVTSVYMHFLLNGKVFEFINSNE